MVEDHKSMGVPLRCNKLVVTSNNCEGLNQCSLLPLGTYLILITVNDHQQFPTKPLYPLNLTTVSEDKTLIIINLKINCIV